MEAFAVMTDFERRLRAAMESAVANEQPPGNLVQQVRRRHRRHATRVGAAGAAAFAVIAILVPLGIGASGHGSDPAGRHRAGAAPTVYVAYPNLGKGGPSPRSASLPARPKPIRLPAFVTPRSPGRENLYVATRTRSSRSARQPTPPASRSAQPAAP